MKKIIFPALTLSLLLSLVQCKKKHNETPTPAPSPPTPEEQLAGGSFKAYKITSLKINGFEGIGQLEACDTNNIYKYYADGRYFQLEGKTKCDPANPDTVFAGTWRINKAGDSLFTKVKSNNFEEGEKIVILSDTAIVTLIEDATDTIQTTLRAR